MNPGAFRKSIPQPWVWRSFSTCVYVEGRMRKEQEIPSFHQAVLCLASDMVCSSWVPDGTSHRELGLQHTPHSSSYGISVARATSPPPTPAPHTTFAQQIVMPGLRVIRSGGADHSREIELDEHDTDVLLPCPSRSLPVSPWCSSVSVMRPPL